MEFIDDAFWDLVYNEFGVVDEIDTFHTPIHSVIYPAPGIIILLTEDFYG
tara:strand:+ start:11316 stop:11465 length:150 start_codon:yes stop_codon:yes gene_type:complete